MSQSTTTTEDVLSVDELARHTDDLALLVAEAIGAPALTAGPADVQDGAQDLLPPGIVHGVIAGLRGAPGALQVVLMLGDGFTPDVPTEPAADAAIDPTAQNVPEPWMAPIADAMERWAQSLGGRIVNAMPVGDAGSLEHLLVRSPGTTLMASGLFEGSDLAGSIAIVGRTEASAGAAPDQAGPDHAPQSSQSPPSPPSPVASVAGSERPASAPRASSAAVEAMHVLAEVEMKVTAELGRTRMTVSDLLALAPGSLIELDRTAGSPIDLLVNGTLIARGEVVVVDEEYGIRLTEITGSAES